MIEQSLHQLCQQDDVAVDDSDSQSFMMRRFLRAAKEVAAHHGSSIFPSKRKKHSTLPPPSSPEQCQNISSTHGTESTAQQVPNVLANSCLQHLQHQEDGARHSVSGFFYRGLSRVALFRACRRVNSVSKNSMLRKKSWAPYAPNHVMVANEGSSLRHSDMEGLVAQKKKAMDGTPKYQSAINTDVDSVNIKESRRRHAKNYRASVSGSHYPGSDGCTNAGRHPPLSQSVGSNLAGNQSERVKSQRSPLDDYLWARELASMAPKEREIETVQEGAIPSDQKRTCDRKFDVKNLTPHDFATSNRSSNTSGDYISGFETNGAKSIHKDGDHDEDDDCELCDALSRLTSEKSDTSFYTFGSPESECNVLGFEGETINDEMDFTDVSSKFETSPASMSENNSLSHVCTANKSGITSGEMSSLIQGIGEGLKLQTESKHAKSPIKHDACAYEQDHECQQAELQVRSFTRLRHHSLDSISGLYPSKASAIFPTLQAKCQGEMPNASGRPFGISSDQSSRVEGSTDDTQQAEKSVDQHAVEENVSSLRSPLAPTDSWLRKIITKYVPSRPLPPAPTRSLLKDASTKNASKGIPLAVLLKKEMVAIDRRKLKSQSMNLDAEWSWEDVVKGRQVHSGNLRCSEELQILMQTGL